MLNERHGIHLYIKKSMTKDKQFILQKANDFLWALIPIQINAVLNSIIYFTRNSRIRNCYYKLFTGANEERHLTSAVLLDQKNTLDSNT